MKGQPAIRIIYILFCVVLLLFATACASRKKEDENVMEPPEAAAPELSDIEIAESETAVATEFETVVAGIDLAAPPTLGIHRPSKDIETDAEAYYITGNSNPDAPLLINGKAVEDRGVFGSFGYFAELREGANTFTLEQDGESQAVTITRKSDGEIYLTDIITKSSPESDDAAIGGEPYTLRCTAPSGASVTARIQNQTITLNQRVATAVEGVPAIFSAEYIPQVSGGIEDIGHITYTLDFYGAKSEYVSGGRLFVTQDTSSLQARAVDVSATVFTEESLEADYFSTLKRGAVDIVTDIGDDMYKLSMGGWVVKSSLELLTDRVETENIVSETVFSVAGQTETLRLKGTAAAPYRAKMSDGILSFTFFRTSGVVNADLAGSRLFSEMKAQLDENNTVIELMPGGTVPLWGYAVEYEQDAILLTFKLPPESQPGDRPLRGVTVALDPGHGGSDTGTLGMSGGSGASEKDINLATAKAARVYLEALGATVIMTRENDDYADLNERLEVFGQPQVDFAVSLHCNSIPYNSDGTRPSGVEIYYYEDASAPFAEAVLKNICDRTGRNNRGIRQANYKVTLNSIAPTIMIEAGFMSNPREYDNLCDPRSIYDAVTAIADGIIESLG